jgi:hypothetical protein
MDSCTTKWISKTLSQCWATERHLSLRCEGRKALAICVVGKWGPRGIQSQILSRPHDALESSMGGVPGRSQQSTTLGSISAPHDMDVQGRTEESSSSLSSLESSPFTPEAVLSPVERANLP